MTGETATAHGIEQIDARTAAGIGLHYGKDVALIYVEFNAERFTLVSEPEYARLLQAASEDSGFTLDAGPNIPIPLIRAGWPDNWETADNASAWVPWMPEA